MANIELCNECYSNTPPEWYAAVYVNENWQLMINWCAVCCEE